MWHFQTIIIIIPGKKGLLYKNCVIFIEPFLLNLRGSFVKGYKLVAES